MSSWFEISYMDLKRFPKFAIIVVQSDGIVQRVVVTWGN
jgi:hypothetical protein